MKPFAILETSLYVNDLAAAERFYGDLLGLPFVSRQEGRHCFFQCGSGMLLIFDARQSNDKEGDLPPHGTSGPGHLAFAVEEKEIDHWQKHLVSNGIEIERQVSWPQGGDSLYFRDPAGNSIELTTPSIWGIDANHSKT